MKDTDSAFRGDLAYRRVEHVGSTRVSGICPKCGGTLQKAGWMLLACTECGARFDVFGNSTMDEARERTDPK